MEVKTNKTFQVKSDVDTVWELLTEPEKVVVCVPGAQLTEKIDEDHFNGKVTIKIGPVTAKFNGAAEFSKRDSSTRELVLQGKGADVSGKGGATMSMELSLSQLDDGTEIRSLMTLSVTGRIAQFGTRMIEAVNNKLFEQFTQNFSNLLSQQNEEIPPISTEAEPLKAVSLVGSVVMSGIKNKFGKTNNRKK